MTRSAEAEQWFYLRGSDEFGPVTSEELKAFLRQGELPPGVSVRRGGASDYVRANEVEELQDPENQSEPEESELSEDVSKLSPAERRRRERMKKYAGRKDEGDDPRELKALPMTQYGIFCIVGINAFMFLYTFLTNGPEAITGPSREGLLDLGADFGPKTVLEHQYWRILTAMFLHAGAAHLLFNMYVLFQFGRLMENLYGRVRFLAAYLLTRASPATQEVCWLWAASLTTDRCSGVGARRDPFSPLKNGGLIWARRARTSTPRVRM